MDLYYKRKQGQSIPGLTDFQKILMQMQTPEPLKTEAKTGSPGGELPQATIQRPVQGSVPARDALSSIHRAGQRATSEKNYQKEIERASAYIQDATLQYGVPAHIDTRGRVPQYIPQPIAREQGPQAEGIVPWSEKNPRPKLQGITQQGQYEMIKKQPDYAELSTRVETTRADNMWGTMGFGVDKTYEYINDIDYARFRLEGMPYNYSYEEFLSDYRLTDDETARQDYKMLVAIQDDKLPMSSKFLAYRQMNSEEIGHYNYLYQKEGRESAEEYLEFLMPRLNERMMTAFLLKRQEYAQEYPVLSSISSVPMNLAGGISGYFDLMLQNAENAQRIEKGQKPKPVDYNTPAQINSNSAGIIRETVEDGIDSDVGKFLYQTGMSIADTAVVAGLTALGIPGGTVLLGAASANQAAKDAKARGATDGQALAVGLMVGAVEVVLEKIPIDEFFKPGKADSTRTWVKNVLKQSLTEGGEEVSSTMLNALVDQIIMQDKSAIETNYKRYLNSGMSEAEARQAAANDFLKEIGNSFVSGSLSGVVLNFGKSAAKGYGTTQGQPQDRALEGTSDQTARASAQPQMGLTEALERMKRGAQVSDGTIDAALDDPQQRKLLEKLLGGEFTGTQQNQRREVREILEDVEELTGGEYSLEKLLDMDYNKTRDRKRWEQDKEILGKHAPESLEEFQKLRYGEDWNTYRAYVDEVKDKNVSPLADFELFRDVSERVDAELIGVKTKTGQIITAKSFTFVSGTIGSGGGLSGGVSVEETLRALTDPVKVSTTKRKQGKPLIKYYSDSVIVTVNAKTGRLMKVTRK